MKEDDGHIELTGSLKDTGPVDLAVLRGDFNTFCQKVAGKFNTFETLLRGHMAADETERNMMKDLVKRVEDRVNGKGAQINQNQRDIQNLKETRAACSEVIQDTQERLDDHEMRMRSVERTVWKWAAGLALIWSAIQIGVKVFF